MNNRMLSLYIITLITMHGNFYASQAPQKETDTRSTLNLMASTSKPTDTVAQQETKEKLEDYSHLTRYLGDHAKTEDFRFQEQVKKNSLAIKQLIEQELGYYPSQHLTKTNWHTVFAMLALQKSSGIKISEKFQAMVTDTIEKATGHLYDKKNKKPTFLSGYRELQTLTTSVLNFSPSEKNLSQPIDAKEPLAQLNELLAECHMNVCYDASLGAKIYLKISPKGTKESFFEKLGKTGIIEALQKSGHKNIQNGRPHNPTFIIMDDNDLNFVDIAFCSPTQKSMRGEELATFMKQGQEKYKAFIASVCKTLNDDLAKKSDACKFSAFTSKLSPTVEHEEFIYATFDAQFLTKARTFLLEQIAKHTPHDEWHDTVKKATTPDCSHLLNSTRQMLLACALTKPSQLNVNSIQELLKDTGSQGALMSEQYKLLYEEAQRKKDPEYRKQKLAAWQAEMEDLRKKVQLDPTMIFSEKGLELRRKFEEEQKNKTQTSSSSSTSSSSQPSLGQASGQTSSSAPSSSSK